MTEYARHHRASREIIIVPVPYEIGSPKHGREVKPARYPSNQHQPWRPATFPPRPTKAQRMSEFMRRVQKQSEEVREMLRPDAALLREWLSAANF
jgi:hypothetical protein